VRIAVSGSHGTGKSTLIAELAGSLPNYVTVEEPYYTLLEDGHVFADPPSAVDFELLFLHSCASLTSETATNVLFDRTPVDYWAYLAAAHREAIMGRSALYDELVAAMARVDLTVFVPIEQPDRVSVDASEGLKVRRRVDALLRAFIVDDTLGLGIPALEVTGTPLERAKQVLTILRPG
jgi:predicted ATPase